MTANQWDLDFLKDAIERILPRHFEVLVDIGLNLNQAREHLHSKLPEIRSWAEIFVRAEPRSDGLVKTRAGKSISMSVSKLLDVEEHVWSPQYGLKGNIDATVQVVMDDDGSRRVLTVPFEVKTGKRASESHLAQTALYTLLLSDRYGKSLSTDSCADANMPQMSMSYMAFSTIWRLLRLAAFQLYAMNSFT
jgi:DNA replication ATP-dependent helicase Dna2